MQINKGFDANFVLALLNGKPLPVDLSAGAEFRASLPPGMDDWALEALHFPRWHWEPDEVYPPLEHAEALPWPEESKDAPANLTILRRTEDLIEKVQSRQVEIHEHKDDWPEVAQLLRDRVDEWIKSGYDDGIERPYTRRLSLSLRWEIAELYRANPISVEVLEWGEIVYESRRTLTWSAKKDHGFAAYEATRLMAGLLGSGLRYAICKCRKPDCDTYFIRSRREEFLKRGSYCAKHSKGAGTAKERDDDRSALLELAVKIYSQWTPDEHPNRALWIANKVNELRNGTERRITQKWVTRNINMTDGTVKARNEVQER